MKEQKTIPELLQQVRKQWNGKKDDSYISLGEIVRLKYNNHAVKVSDLAIKLNNNEPINIPLTQIIKKRAAYQQYLLNRQNKHKDQSNKENQNAITFPEIKFPSIEFPKIKMLYNQSNENSNNHKTKNQRQRW
ncbi:MAG: hypothetical protein QXN16_00600 [Candidatus Micrarchaeaceae archaeon]